MVLEISLGACHTWVVLAPTLCRRFWDFGLQVICCGGGAWRHPPFRYCAWPRKIKIKHSIHILGAATQEKPKREPSKRGGPSCPAERSEWELNSFASAAPFLVGGWVRSPTSEGVCIWLYFCVGTPSARPPLPRLSGHHAEVFGELFLLLGHLAAGHIVPRRGGAYDSTQRIVGSSLRGRGGDSRADFRACFLLQLQPSSTPPHLSPSLAPRNKFGFGFPLERPPPDCLCVVLVILVAGKP